MEAVAKMYRVKQSYWTFSGAKGSRLDTGDSRILVRGKVREPGLKCDHFLLKTFVSRSLSRQDTQELSRKSLTDQKI